MGVARLDERLACVVIVESAIAEPDTSCKPSRTLRDDSLDRCLTAHLPCEKLCTPCAQPSIGTSDLAVKLP
jgi:hypothetical protein